jgi:uncharacterized protein YecE (DUF72 family)
VWPAARARHARAIGRAKGGGSRTVGDRVIGGTLYAGTSGFSYASWKGVFYPANLPGRRMLEFYSQRLNGVELNGSFYRTPPESTLAAWAGGTNQQFRFCMKAHRGLTYSADAFDRVGLAAIIGERLAPLGDRLGPVLLQFPPARQRNIGLLDGLLSALGRPVAAEFRHESWFDDETYRTLRAHGAALVVTDEEKWPRAPFATLGPIAYFRLRRGYDSDTLKPWLADVRAAIASHEQVHVYFKHDPEAPALAEQLLQSAG